ncbi:DUF739 domain-containing protein [Clostridium sp. P21]|uniref:DUF739 domain-containing protein n=1 Tax=Clostridium muellerianum TaxID=2716538 RepID=A0A7Y0HLV3_9CLOT|nr:DUF739 domain-containing protein [Clostridium muellerianum]NMM62354.1 DUF739 domain-containing protein [Clostridium muellerianum]
MVNVKLLKAQMVLNNYTIGKLAREIGVSTKTLSTRLNKSPENFKQVEIEKIVIILKISDPMSIFLTF